MKIVIINGQDHKGSSYHMGKFLADQLAPAQMVTEFFLPRDLNHFCLEIQYCFF